MNEKCYIRNEKGELSGPFPRETVAQMLVAGLLPAHCTILSSSDEAADRTEPLPTTAGASAREGTSPTPLKATTSAPAETTPHNTPSSAPSATAERTSEGDMPQSHSSQALSPLFAAVDAGDATTFMALVNAGEDVYTLDAEGHSLRWHAKGKGCADILEMLTMMEDFNGRPITAPADEESARPDGKSVHPSAHDPVSKGCGAATASLTRVQLCRLKKDIERAVRFYSTYPIDPGFICDWDRLYTLMRQFIDGGGSIDELVIKIKGDSSISIIYIAASKDGGAQTLRYLIEAGVDVNARDEYGRTPLCWARTAEVAELLIDAGADVNARDECGRTPLHWARTAEVAELLIDVGADVNARDVNGHTPLCWAGTAEVAELLIDAGADVNARDERGLTPLDFVVVKEIAQVIRAAGGKES